MKVMRCIGLFFWSAIIFSGDQFNAVLGQNTTENANRTRSDEPDGRDYTIWVILICILLLLIAIVLLCCLLYGKSRGKRTAGSSKRKSSKRRSKKSRRSKSAPPSEPEKVVVVEQEPAKIRVSEPERITLVEEERPPTIIKSHRVEAVPVQQPVVEYRTKSVSSPSHRVISSTEPSSDIIVLRKRPRRKGMPYEEQQDLYEQLYVQLDPSPAPSVRK